MLYLRVNKLISRPVPVLFSCGILLLAGCGRDDIRVYRVPKEQGSGMMAGGDAHAGHNHAEQAPAPSLKWSTPEGWEVVPPGEMRAASFRVKGEKGNADVGVFPLPGLAGKDLDNVNRWRSQVGLEPITDDKLKEAGEPVQIAGAEGQLYNMAGEAPGSGDATRILAAILHRDGVAWFFKMTGEDALVAAQKSAFVQFLKSVEFVQGEAAPAEGSLASQELPASHPPIEGAMMASGGMPSAAGAGAATADVPSWQVPKGWETAPAGQFLVAKFNIKGEGNAQAAVNVSMSAGDGGGVASNVNRWRGQLGLPVVASEQLKLEKLALASGEAVLSELEGTDGRTGEKARLVGVVVPQTGRAWFYKLMGNPQLVDREKNAFIEFIKTAKY